MPATQPILQILASPFDRLARTTPKAVTQLNPDERGFDNCFFDCAKWGHSEAWVVKELYATLATL